MALHSVAYDSEPVVGRWRAVGICDVFPGSPVRQGLIILVDSTSGLLHFLNMLESIQSLTAHSIAGPVVGTCPKCVKTLGSHNFDRTSQQREKPCDLSNTGHCRSRDSNNASKRNGLSGVLEWQTITCAEANGGTLCRSIHNHPRQRITGRPGK